MKKIVILLCCVIVCGTVTAQSSLQRIWSFDFSLTKIGFSYNLPIGSNSLIDFEAQLGHGYKITDLENGDNSGILPAYGAKLEYRIDPLNQHFGFAVGYRLYYYQKDNHNSGSYIGFQLKTVTQSIDYRGGGPSGTDANWVLLANMHWGIQRHITNRLLFNFRVGAGYFGRVGYNHIVIAPSLDFKFSYVL
jgi:hypothetical protein